MKRFLVINPNTSFQMTASIKDSLDPFLSADLEIDVVQAEYGPESLESFYEYSIAAAAVGQTLQNLKRPDYDGILLACFGDPGLYGIKEIAPCPVIGIAEASLSISLLLGYKFSIIVALQKAVPMMTNMVQQYGLSQRLAGVFPLNLPVLDVEENSSLAKEKIVSVGKEAVRAGAEVLVLGCAGMTGYAEYVREELGLTVIDPVITGFAALRAIVEGNLATSRIGLYEPVLNKKMNGMPEERS